MTLNKLIYFLFLFVVSACKSQELEVKTNKGIASTSSKYDYNKLKTKAKIAFEFCQQHQMDTNFCILIDLSMHSGLNRFFVWDLKKDTILQSCLVSHGCGANPWSRDFSKDSPSFSNENNSHCSSLGKYKVENRSYSNWGVHIKYLMYGLDSTNSNAFKREIVFHSWEAISNEETFPKGTPEGWGCPAISNKEFIKVDTLLKTVKNPVLMWVFSN